jgi:hypothetical protein
MANGAMFATALASKFMGRLREWTNKSIYKSKKY